MTTQSELLNFLRRIRWEARDVENVEGAVEKFHSFLVRYGILIRQFLGPSGALTSPYDILRLNSPISEETYDEVASLVNGSTMYELVLCRHALEWASLCESRHPVTAGREDLFEVPLELMRRRVTLFLRKGFIEVGRKSAIPVFAWMEWPEILDAPLM